MATTADVLRPADPVAPIDVDERVPLLFDFADMDGADSVSGMPVLTCEATAGEDASAASRLDGTPTVSGLQVAVWMHNVQPGVTYLVRCKAAMASGARLTRAIEVPALRVGGGAA